MSHCPTRENVTNSYVAGRSEGRIQPFPLMLFLALCCSDSSGDALWCQLQLHSFLPELTGVPWICLIWYQSLPSPTGNLPFNSQTVLCTLVFCTKSHQSQSPTLPPASQLSLAEQCLTAGSSDPHHCLCRVDLWHREPRAPGSHHVNSSAPRCSLCGERD